MATLQFIYNKIVGNITPSSSADRITSAEAREVFELLRAEFLNRGVLQVADVSLLATLANTESKVVYVEGVGVFRDVATGPANSYDCYAGSGGRFWRLVEELPKLLQLSVGGFDGFTVPAGRVIYMLIFTPTATDQTFKVGLTLGGDEIMLEETVVANTDKLIMMPIICRTDKQVFITGIVDSTDVRIYTKPL